MNKYFELWLDESGQFEEEAKLKERNYSPSLVGGILLEKTQAERVNFDSLLRQMDNHAMGFSDVQKREYVLPTLEKLITEYYARLVFFENAEYEDENSGRQLYLRILAEGLLQLLQTLNAEYESVVLEVLIAQRQDVHAVAGKRRIQEAEYIHALKKCIEQKKKEHKIFLDDDSELHFKVRAAHTENKLQLADFACNTRLTRNSKAFVEVRERVEALYKNAYLFTLAELGSVNYIKRSLAQGYLSDAIMELYSTQDELNHEKELSLIMERVCRMDSRQLKTQLEQCRAEIIGYVKLQDDFKIGEQVLIQLQKEFIEKLHERGIPCKKLEFSLLLQLVNTYIKEGNIVEARRTLEACKKVQSTLGNRLEEVFSYYLYKRAEVLCAINEFDYTKACEICIAMETSFANLMKAVCMEGNLKNRFPEISSGYYNDTVGLHICAMRFMQKKQPDLYQELCQLSDHVLKQEDTLAGELERHRQYRSHIELEQGNYKQALYWLCLALEVELQEINILNIIAFLDKVCMVKSELGSRYYLMYYVLLLSASKRWDEAFAHMLWQALIKQKRLLILGGLWQIQLEEELLKVDIEKGQEEQSGMQFHPLEIINWKYASYLYQCKKYQAAYRYYEKAEQICFAYPEHHMMGIIGISVRAEKICCMIKNKDKGAKREWEILQDSIEELLQAPLSPVTRQYVEGLKSHLKECCLKDGTIQVDALWSAAQRNVY